MCVCAWCVHDACMVRAWHSCGAHRVLWDDRQPRAQLLEAERADFDAVDLIRGRVRVNVRVIERADLNAVDLQ